MIGTPVTHHPVLAVDQVVQRLEGLIAPRYPDDISYDLVSLPLPDFLRGMEEIGPCNGRRFLDVGCGIGTKLAVAYYLGWGDLTGVELRDEYAVIARRLCPEAWIEVADAMTWHDYAQFDVVYMYRPYIEDTDQKRLETYILSRLRSGTTVFWPQRGGVRVI